MKRASIEWIAMDRQLSPAEIAKRFGVSIKALRVYEEHGLLTPSRISSGSTKSAWRAYGPEHVARLHQIIVLKRLGLPLARIGEILAASDTLAQVLVLQEQVLSKDRDRIDRSLALIRAAKSKLASGESLSIDDLASLMKETVMPYPSEEELKAIVTPFKQKRLTPDENVTFEEWKTSHESIVNEVKSLQKQTLELMINGDATSPEAMALAKRWRDLGKRMRDKDPTITTLAPKMNDIMNDAMADAESAPKLAPVADLRAFVAKIVARQREQEAS